MKTMTCKDLGGTCDQKLSAESWNEMVGLMVKHVTENHPDVAKQMEQMHNTDPKKWGREPNPSGKPLPKTSGFRIAETTGPAADELETLGRAHRSCSNSAKSPRQSLSFVQDSKFPGCGPL